MSLDQAAAQVLLIGFVGSKQVSEKSKKVLSSLPVGGVILFSYNIRGGPENLIHLTSELQEIAGSTEPGLPYLVAVDHEGGKVQRLKRGFTKLPPPLMMGRLARPILRKLASLAAIQLRSVGVNMNLAPVVEAAGRREDVIGDRGFSRDPQAASSAASAFIQGMQSKGVLATAKHFPGNAVSSVDPHSDMPVISLTLDSIRARLLPPFKAAVDAGVDAVMLSHAMVPALDADNPVAFSKAVVQGLLRNELGFEGIAVSDDLLMGAVVKRYDPSDAAVMALRAGVDLLMVSDPSKAEIIRDKIVSAIEKGRLAESRLRQACSRIVSAKAKRKIRSDAPGVDMRDELAKLARARKNASRLLLKYLKYDETP